MISKLPNLLCVGAQKAGTTTLADLLRDHPDIYFPNQKEVHFFENPKNFGKGMHWYASLYEESGDSKYRADFTPDYLHRQDLPPIIKKVLGDRIKVIILLRHPVDRLYSQYNFYRTHLVESEKSLEKAIQAEREQKGNKPFQEWYKPAYYLQRSMYFKQVKLFIEVFGKGNVYVGLFEHIIKNNNAQKLQPILDFLEIEPFLQREQVHGNKTEVPKNYRLMKAIDRVKGGKEWVKRVIPLQYYQKLRNTTLNSLKERPAPLDADLRNRLYLEYFEQDVARLEDYLDQDLSAWYEKKSI